MTNQVNGAVFSNLTGAYAAQPASADAAGASNFQDILARLEAQESGGAAETATDGIARYGLAGWADVSRRHQAEVRALASVLHDMGTTSAAVEQMSFDDQAKLEAKVSDRVDSMAQAVKEDALEKAEKKKSVLYRHTPPKPDKNTLPGI